jgi:hypothetical protein
VKVVFIPTVSHLRAYLAAFEEEDQEWPPALALDNEGRKGLLMVVYGLVGLHRETSEWSAQGLGNSVSMLVEVGERCSRELVCFEERGVEGLSGLEGEMEGEGVEGSRWKEVCKVWEEKVPMLNGSVRRAGLDSKNETWSGRSVEVGRIFGRWFRFGRGDVKKHKIM